MKRTTKHKIELIRLILKINDDIRIGQAIGNTFRDKTPLHLAKDATVDPKALKKITCSGVDIFNISDEELVDELTKGLKQ